MKGEWRRIHSLISSVNSGNGTSVGVEGGIGIAVGRLGESIIEGFVVGEGD